MENWARKRLKSEGYHVVKLANLAGPGFPDHTLFLGGGRVAFIEYKTPKGRFGPLQEWWLGKLEDFGCPTAVCRSKEDVEAFIGTLS